jgi:hypothetical protein
LKKQGVDLMGRALTAAALDLVPIENKPTEIIGSAMLEDAPPGPHQHAR